MIVAICVQKAAALGESELREFPTQATSSLKIPKELHFFTEFPHTPCGKNLIVQALKLQIGLWRFHQR